MTEDDIKARINVVAARFKAERDKAMTKNDEDFAEMLISGVELLGEFLVDVKRLADATVRLADTTEEKNAG